MHVNLVFINTRNGLSTYSKIAKACEHSLHSSPIFSHSFIFLARLRLGVFLTRAKREIVCLCFSAMLARGIAEEEEERDGGGGRGGRGRAGSRRSQETPSRAVVSAYGKVFGRVAPQECPMILPPLPILTSEMFRFIKIIEHD